MTTSISIRVDKDLKQQAEILFKDIGLTMSAAFALFLRRSVQVQGIPFPVLRMPNAETVAAMEESDRIARDPQIKGYRDLDELWRDLEA